MKVNSVEAVNIRQLINQHALSSWQKRLIAHDWHGYCARPRTLGCALACSVPAKTLVYCSEAPLKAQAL